jgi:hypothetical protein
MKEYKYNINVFSSNVRAEIFYELECIDGHVNQIGSCSKTFGEFSFKNYPSEKNLLKAQKWAQEQCEIMNKIQ